VARVPYRDVTELTPAHQPLLARPINLFLALANSPEALARFHPFGEWIRWDSELDSRLRELVILQVGYLCGSEYEFTHHVQISRQFGVTNDDVVSLIAFAKGETAPSLSELERLALTATRELTEHREISDDTWAGLAMHLDPGRLVDLVVIVAFYNMVVRILAGLQVDNEPEYRAVLDRFPLMADRLVKPARDE
jgi:alkylhydroperoxidase family enzyme